MKNGQPPKVLFIIPTLERGGSEKVLATIVQHIDHSRFEVTVAVVSRPGIYYDQLPDQVYKVLIGAHRVKWAAPALIRTVRKANPDIVVSFNVNHLNLIVIPVLLLLRFRGSFVTRESSVLSQVTAQQGRLGGFINATYRKLNWRATRVIAQSSFTANDLIENFGVKPKQLVVINNPVNYDQIQQLAQEGACLLPSGVINLLAVGRLSPVKGFDKLIKAFELLPNNYHLTILGGETYEHPEHAPELYQLVSKLGLDNRVNFANFQSNPYSYMQQADLLMITSHYEGFPNVAVEAMALGTPVVAFDSPGGHNDLIKDGMNGWLVPFGNLKAFADTVIQAQGATIDRSMMRQLIRDNYDIPSVVRSYESLLLELSNE